MGDVRKEVFKCIDGNLYYVAAKSASNSMWGLVDGSEYTLQAEDTFKETMDSNSEPETVDESDSDISSEYVGIETKLFEKMAGEYWIFFFEVVTAIKLLKHTLEKKRDILVVLGWILFASQPVAGIIYFKGMYCGLDYETMLPCTWVAPQ